MFRYRRIQSYCGSEQLECTRTAAAPLSALLHPPKSAQSLLSNPPLHLQVQLKRTF